MSFDSEFSSGVTGRLGTSAKVECHGIRQRARVLYHSMCVVRHGHCWDDSPHPTHAMATRLQLEGVGFRVVCNTTGLSLMSQVGLFNATVGGIAPSSASWRFNHFSPNPPCHTPTVVWTDISREAQSGRVADVLLAKTAGFPSWGAAALGVAIFMRMEESHGTYMELISFTCGFSRSLFRIESLQTDA